MPDAEDNHTILTAKQGLQVSASDTAAFNAALDHAVNYRGDVTLRLRPSGETIEGFIFDRAQRGKSGQARIRILPSDGSARRTIPEGDIEHIEFTGRDTASGRSFETWMKKYVEKKMAGKEASIQSEPLDES